MDLLQNPFYILNAKPRDNRSRISELAEERSLSFDPDLCREASSTLTNPRKRLAAEMAWLPGVTPERTKQFLDTLNSSSITSFSIQTAKNEPAMAKANVFAGILKRLEVTKTENVTSCICILASTFDEVDSGVLRNLINEDRNISSFPAVTDISAIEKEIEERRNYFRQIIKEALDQLPSEELVHSVTEAIEKTTNIGEYPAPILLSDLVDAYEVESQDFFAKAVQSIKNQIEKIQRAMETKQPDSTLAPIVQLLIQMVKRWDMVAQPIQVCARSQGRDHRESRKLASQLRDLAINMYNQHGKLEFSQQVTKMIREVFAEVDVVAEWAAEDANELEKIANNQRHLMEEAKKRTEQWVKSITYETKIYQDKFRISQDGIEWKGKCWPLNTVTKVRWGGYINDIPTDISYIIYFGTEKSYEIIATSKENIYKNIVEKLWNAVGIQIFTNILEGLTQGNQYKFGTSILTDTGIELTHKVFFGNDKHIFCNWHEINIWNGPGTFHIGKHSDNKFITTLKYLEHDNVHILEAILRTFYSKGKLDKLSNLLTK